MTETMTTVLDADGVLFDYTGHTLELLDVGLTIDDIKEFNLRSALKNLRGREVARRADAIRFSAKFCAGQPLLPWARELVELCMDLGDILILTAPSANRGWYDARIEALRTKLNLHQDNVMVGRAKFRVSADLFVDDKPSNIIEWATDDRRRPSDRAVLLAWPYNEGIDLPPNASRLTPDELLRQLRTLKEGQRDG